MTDYKENFSGMRLIKDETLTALADAIRSAEDSTDTMTPEEMAARMREYGELMVRLKDRTITSEDLQKLLLMKADGESYPTVGMRAYAYCKQITYVELPPDNINWWNSQGAFSDCTNLKTVDFSKWNFRVIVSSMFNNTGIEELDLPEKITTVSWSFSNCKSLKKVTFHGANITALSDSFYNCSALELLDFSDYTGEALPTITKTDFTGTNTTFKILVPVSMIRSAKIATNWSTRASQIVCSLEEGYTVTGTIPIGTYINGVATTAEQTEIAGVHCIGAPVGGEIVLSDGTTITAEQGDVLLDADIAIGGGGAVPTYYAIYEWDDASESNRIVWTTEEQSGVVQLTNICPYCGAVHKAMVTDNGFMWSDTDRTKCQNCGEDMGAFITRDGLHFCTAGGVDSFFDESKADGEGRCTYCGEKYC